MVLRKGIEPREGHNINECRVNQRRLKNRQTVREVEKADMEERDRSLIRPVAWRAVCTKREYGGRRTYVPWVLLLPPPPPLVVVLL